MFGATLKTDYKNSYGYEMIKVDLKPAGATVKRAVLWHYDTKFNETKGQLYGI
jgi:hypothetical protein